MRDVRDGALTAACVEVLQYGRIPVFSRMGIVRMTNMERLEYFCSYHKSKAKEIKP